MTLLSRSKSWSYSRSVSSVLEITSPARSMRCSRMRYSNVVSSTGVPPTCTLCARVSNDTLPHVSCGLAQPPARRSSACSRASTSSKRSEEHTSELQSRGHLVCRLLLEKKKKKQNYSDAHET